MNGSDDFAGDAGLVLWESVGADRTFTRVSGSAGRLLGFAPDRWLDSGFWRAVLHPGDREAAVAQFAAALAAGRLPALDYRVIAADGRTLRVRDLASRSDPAGGGHARLCGVLVVDRPADGDEGPDDGRGAGAAHPAEAAGPSPAALLRASQPQPESQLHLQPAPAPEPEPEPACRSLAVLYAEDDVTSAQVISQLLLLLDVMTEIAVNGADAVAMYREGTFDLVLMDIRMPVMNGLEAARAIRAIEAAEGRARVPIVGITAEGGDFQTAAHEAGMDGMLTKPVRFERLRALVEPLQAGLGGGSGA